MKNSFPEKITPHLEKLIEGGSNAVSRQFLNKISARSKGGIFISEDPFLEEKFSPVKGIIHKYTDRVLWKVSLRCAAYCRFCNRKRQVGTSFGDLSERDIKRGLEYIKRHKEIKEVILSGGDPFYNPAVTAKILRGLKKVPSIKIIRVGTRLPVSSPDDFKKKEIQKLLIILIRISKRLPVFILVHINHPDELTVKTKKALKDLRERGFTVMSQTVFLRGINDNYRTLSMLFRELHYLGVVPYYIFRCDYVSGLESFLCDIKKERKIMTRIHKNLPGIAVPKYVIDVPGKGKIPVPLEFWGKVGLSYCKDFTGKKIII